MTTVKQVRQLVIPLLERHPELALVGTAVVVKPVRHLMHYMTVGRTSSAEIFEPTCNVVGMAGRFREFPLGGKPIYGPRRIWRWTEDRIDELFVEVVEQEALPWLAQTKTLRDHMERVFISDEHRQAWAPGYVRLLLLLGDLDEARDVLLRSESADAYWLPELTKLGIKERLLSLGADLDKSDRRTLAGFFHELERSAAAKLKTEHLWEPTPFPLEERAPGE